MKNNILSSCHSMLHALLVVGLLDRRRLQPHQDEGRSRPRRRHPPARDRSLDDLEFVIDCLPGSGTQRKIFETIYRSCAVSTGCTLLDQKAQIRNFIKTIWANKWRKFWRNQRQVKCRRLGDLCCEFNNTWVTTKPTKLFFAATNISARRRRQVSINLIET